MTDMWDRCKEHKMPYPRGADCPKCERESKGSYVPPRNALPPPPPREDPTIRVGDDETTRREKAMGLDIDPKTNRAYESQGDFANLNLAASGRFYNGKAVPRAVQCAGCGARVVEDQWGRGFQGCGALDFNGQFFLCSECVLKVLHLFPRIRGVVAAMHGGDLKRG